MKLKIFKTKKYTLIKLYLLKYQTYKKTIDFNILAQIDCIEIYIRQALKITRLYHLQNKKILFVGFPYFMSNITRNQSAHSFVPKTFWMEYLSKKNMTKSSNLKKSKNRKSLNSIVQTYDLIVFFNVDTKQFEVITNFQKLKIPLILIGNQIPPKIISGVYSIPLSLSQTPIRQLFYYLFYSILKIRPKEIRSNIVDRIKLSNK